MHEPRLFERLAAVHEGLRRFGIVPTADPLDAMPEDAVVREALVAIGWPEAMRKLRQSAPIGSRRVQGWLGARRTMRLEHALRGIA